MAGLSFSLTLLVVSAATSTIKLHHQFGFVWVLILDHAVVYAFFVVVLHQMMQITHTSQWQSDPCYYWNKRLHL